MRIFVTGSSGFIGQKFVQRANKFGHSVTPLGRKATSSQATFHELDLLSSLENQRIPWDEADAVVHLAAAGAKATQRNWKECLLVNVVGTQNLLEAISLSKTTPIVWIASTFYEDEVHRIPSLMENPYIATKYTSRLLASAWARNYGGSAIFGKIFQVYGAGDNPDSVLQYACSQLAKKRVAKFGSGVGLRDWITVEDVADAILASLLAAQGGIQCFDIGTGDLASIREVIEKLADLSGSPRSLLEFDSSRDKLDKNVQSKAKLLPAGWKPALSLDEGLKRLWKAK